MECKTWHCEFAGAGWGGRQEAGITLTGYCVHWALSVACLTGGVQAYPALWLAFASQKDGRIGSGTGCSGCAASGTGGDRIRGRVHAPGGVFRTTMLPTLRGAIVFQRDDSAATLCRPFAGAALNCGFASWQGMTSSGRPFAVVLVGRRRMTVPDRCSSLVWCQRRAGLRCPRQCHDVVRGRRTMPFD